MTETSEVREWLRRTGSSKSPYNLMRDSAQDLLSTYHRDHPRAKYPPVASKLAPLRRIRIEVEDMDFSGSLEITEEGFIATQSARHNFNHRNFTVAHEIGHTYFFDIEKTPPAPLLTPSKLSTKAIDLLCDHFAVNLLVPENELRRFEDEINNLRCSLSTIENISKRFRVSCETLIRQISNLGILTAPTHFFILVKQKTYDEPPSTELIVSDTLQLKLYFNANDMSIRNVSSGEEKEVVVAGNLGGKDVAFTISLKVYGDWVGKYAIGLQSVENDS